MGTLLRAFAVRFHPTLGGATNPPREIQAVAPETEFLQAVTATRV